MDQCYGETCQGDESWPFMPHSSGWHPEVHGARALGQDSGPTGLGHGPPASRRLFSGSALVGNPEPLPRFATW